MTAKEKRHLHYEAKDKKGRVILIRPYAKSDYQALSEMYEKFEPKGLEAGLPPQDTKVRRQWLDSVINTFFNIVAVHRGQIIGHAALDLKTNNICPEYLIFISKPYRYAGIGTRLCEAVKEIAGDKGCRKLWLTVRTGNTIAIRLFKKVGFKFVGDMDIQREMELPLEQQ